MARNVDQILQEAKELSPDDRERLLEGIAATLDDRAARISPEWREELIRRIERLDREGLPTRTAHQAAEEFLRVLEG